MTVKYEFHPLANEFPLMEGAEFDDLVADIAANGQQNPIIMFQNLIIDGRNRYLACVKLGIEPLRAPFPILEAYEHARAYVISANIHRRMLTPDAKRTIIEALLLADPTLSDRAIAEQAKTYPRKVGRVRKRMAATVTSVTVDRHVGLDGKKRKVPAPKPTEQPAAEGAAFAAEKEENTSKTNGPENDSAANAAPDVPATSQAEPRKRPSDNQEDDPSEFELGIFDLGIYSRREGADLKAAVRAARRAGVTISEVRELAAWLGSLADAMGNKSAVKTAADRAANRAKKNTPVSEELGIPAESKRE